MFDKLYKKKHGPVFLIPRSGQQHVLNKYSGWRSNQENTHCVWHSPS